MHLAKSRQKKLEAMFIIFGICAGIFSACGPNESQGSDESRESITRGKTLKSSSELSKSVVALVADLPTGQALCTGSILTENLILTAAHCVDNNPTQIQIIFSNNVRQSRQDERRLATSVFQNPFWKKPNTVKQGDLAIIAFSGGLPSGFTPVHLAQKSFKPKEGESVLFVGYGVTNGIQHSGAGVLRMTKTTIIGQQSPTEVITDGRQTSVCFGDSGGPAFAFVNNDFIQWGVASSVSNQACNEASIHTAVMNYETWIKSAIRKYSNADSDSSSGNKPKAGRSKWLTAEDIPDDSVDP